MKTLCRFFLISVCLLQHVQDGGDEGEGGTGEGERGEGQDSQGGEDGSEGTDGQDGGDSADGSDGEASEGVETEYETDCDAVVDDEASFECSAKSVSTGTASSTVTVGPATIDRR